ncbi:TetR/AcrR family transcriptional regulator [Pleomorphomonas oryzae]|uniref:TetR/AcrR family transcriptional regulator n=1 Tax=Pleomorphomonas oryzae TaxID=261934 RepID=UPI000688C6FC|nr:TetR/AcrR family transcriptional regulator [Pleomorphomonas oryzae]
MKQDHSPAARPSSHASSGPASRRERPAKVALTRELIVATALDILNEEGLEKVTMRAIAGRLDTGPASLYVYVRNTEDLHAQLLDALIAGVPEAAAERPGASVDAADWRGQLIGLLMTYTERLYSHPAIARLSLFARSNGPNSLRMADALLKLLRQGGVADASAAWAIDLMMHFATATAAEQSSDQHESKIAATADAIEAADPALYPNLAAIDPLLLFSGDGLERYTWAVNVLIDGVLTAVPPTPDTSRLAFKRD